MKNLFKFVGVLSLILVFAFTPVIVAQAAAEAAPAVQEQAPITLPDLVATLQTLTGFAMLVPALVNVGKKFGWVGDDEAPTWSLGLNAVGLMVLVGLQLSGKFDLVPVLDENAGALAVAINAVVALVYQIFVSRKTHENALAGLPVIGESHSGRQAGEGPALEVDLQED